MNNRLNLLPASALATMDTVVDVGANVGDWTAAIVDIARPRRVVAIEPTPSLLPDLRRRFDGRPDVEIVAVAVGDHDGTTAFNLASHSHGSSVLSPTVDAGEIVGPGILTIDTISVPMQTLDTLLRDEVKISLCKIDVQGFERSVLAGAEAALERMDRVLLEANFVHQYEGDALLPELHDALTGRGFELENMSTPLVSGGRAIFSDVLYRRLAST